MDTSSHTISPKERAATRKQLIASLQDRGYRAAFVRQQIETGLPFQIRGIRQSQELSQSQLGNLLEKPQSVISRLENPGYGRFTIATLLELASAFDVALLVAFVPFSALVNRVTDFSIADVEIQNFANDPGLTPNISGSTVVDLFRSVSTPGAALDDEFTLSSAEPTIGDTRNKMIGASSNGG